MRVLLIWAAIAPAVLAQQGRVDGPVAGWVFDGSTRALRPIRGIPGAATIGAPVALGFELSSAVVSPKQDSAFAIAADQAVHFLRIVDGRFEEHAIRGATSGAQSIVYSPSGNSAALLSGSTATILTDLPAGPQVSGVIEMGSATEAVWRVAVLRRRSVALSDDGRYLLAAAGQATLFSTSGEQRRIAAAGRVLAAAFAPGAHEAVLATTGGMLLVPDVSESVPGSSLSASEAAADATRVAFSADGSRIVALSASGKFTVVDRHGTSLPAGCDCTAATLTPMGTLFRLGELNAGPLWLLDPAEPKTIFVPAVSAN